MFAGCAGLQIGGRADYFSRSIIKATFGRKFPHVILNFITARSYSRWGAGGRLRSREVGGAPGNCSAPVFRAFPQPACDRIAIDVAELFLELRCIPDIEIADQAWWE